MKVQTESKLPWPEFLARFHPNQGEHITLLGPTGSGKTTLALQILPYREHIVAFGCKRRDSTLQSLIRKGWKKSASWPVPYRYKKVVLWPEVRNMREVIRQRNTFYLALDDIFRRGGWSVYLDEVLYLTDHPRNAGLGLAGPVQLLLQQGRALGVTMIAGTQRPRHVPLAFYSQATHLFLWKNSDENDLKRLDEIGGFPRGQVADVVSGLQPHEVLYLDKVRRIMVRTKAQKIGAKV